MAKRRSIHWVIPTNSTLAFLSGCLLALGHHLFYESLNGEIVATGSYHVANSTVSKQQFNIAVGTAFAFIVKSMLAMAITVAYTQLFWRVLRKADRGVRLASADAAFSALQDITALFKVSVWWRHPMLFLIVVLFWALPLASIFTPGTLSVHSVLKETSSMAPVPQLDFLNTNFINVMHTFHQAYHYNGPSTLTQRLVDATAWQGEIFPIDPPAPNASWSLSTWGPGIACANASNGQKSKALESYGSYLLNNSTQDSLAVDAKILPYFSWIKGYGENGSSIPFKAVDLQTQITFDPFYSIPISLMIAFNPNVSNAVYPIFYDKPGENYMDLSYNESVARLEALHGWPRVLSDFTVLRCDVFNSSYDIQFGYTNGAQNITASVQVDREQPSIGADTFYFPTGNGGTWNTTDCNLDTDNRPCYKKEWAAMAAYEGIAHAFNALLSGAITMDNQSSSQITESVLMYTDELAFLNFAQGAQDPAETWRAFPNRDISPLRSSRGSLARALERLFQNITLNVLSEPYLQPNFSNANSISPLANVTFITDHNVYQYDSVTLWVAYSIAVFCTALATLVGYTAMRNNGVAFGADFSTVLRASRIDHTAEASTVEGVSEDDGRKPLPKQLANAMVVIHSTGLQRSEPEDILTKEGGQISSESLGDRLLTRSIMPSDFEE
ncbi:hypothetical protein K431DRAFT_30342 [Polychaeton citri CBS 116435]|uniref:Uncharacterized protein n=1 Tax=Polychaeton citri CBS 116435 TaxID=1314669 RepID=A0A9P4PW56_9PEZI|nr:hypothetical protein K431DRAFT_30342 [Polychaeton citri CBS 116435]